MNHFDQEQKKHENQIKLLLLGSAAPRDDSETIDRKSLGQFLPLDNIKVRVIPTKSRYPTILPFDVWLELFLFLDIKTLTVLRCVCKGIRTMINTCPRYILLHQNVPHLIRAYLVTGAGLFTSLDQVCKAYVSTKCAFEGCTNDGEYIYLLRAERLCSFHLQEIKLVPMTKSLSRAITKSGIAPGKVPLIRPLMGSPHKTSYADGGVLALIGKTTKLPAWKATSPRRMLGTRYGLHCLKSCLRTPWLDVTTKKNDWGYRCKPCASEAENTDANTALLSKLTYTSEGMLKHFEACFFARARWRDFSPKKDRSRIGEEARE